FNTDLPDVKFGGKNDPDTPPETNKRTVLIINEDGIHWWTADNQYVTVDLDANICINKNVKIKVGENADVHIKGSTKLHVDGQTDLYFDGVLNIKSDATINIQGGPNINLNCGTSAAQAEDNKGYNEKPGADKELTGISRVGDMALAAAKIGKKLK
ncbi:MAG: hypothetical protein H8D97_00195, partial [Proteobacteria bacterium]|nr:hypothetical protein [Pseudomonadota bacterium]